MIFEFERPLLLKIWDLAVAINKRKKVDLTVKKGGESPVKKMFLGLRAQYAVNHVLETPFDWEVYEGSDNGIDGTYKGKTYQVKYSQYLLPDVYLAFSKDQPLVAEIAFLVIPAINEKANMNVRLLGFIEAERFFELAHRKEWASYAAEKAVHNRVLTPFKDILPPPPPPVLKKQLNLFERGESWSFNQ
jgi:hypothetical protein